LPFSLTEPVSDNVYVVQVRSLFSSVTPSIVMAGIFILNVWVAYEKTDDRSLLLLGWIGCVLNVWRIVAAVAMRKLAATPLIDRSDAAELAALFAVPYVSFAALLGAFGYIIFGTPYPDLHMLTVGAAVGYCAGVAAGCGLRPALALSSILLAMGPIICASLMKGDNTYSALALVAAALIGGAARSMMVRSNESKAEIAARISSGSLARRDVLTSLPNRLALAEFYAGRLALSAPETMVAVHYLDLDGFKPVNDELGHAAGDQVLLAVANRLRSVVRKSDMVARLGGDEFAIVQIGLKDAEEAHDCAWHVRETIQEPYEVVESGISITTSIGTVFSSDRSSTLDDLLQLADEKLYAVKRAKRKMRFGTAVA
jgi:diguanylate cyclase (GGDEF)-like protein